MSYIFVSYSRKDKNIIDELVEGLQSAGYEVWTDRNILGGTLWRHQIVTKIEGCDVFILTLSSNSINSDNVRKELDLAANSGKKIIPVDLETVTIPQEMQYQLVGLQRIDLVNHHGIKPLLNTLGEVGKRSMSGSSHSLATPEKLQQERLECQNPDEHKLTRFSPKEQAPPKHKVLPNGRRMTALVTALVATVITTIMMGWVVWLQEQEAQQEQLTREVLNGAITIEDSEKLADILPDYLERARRHQQENRIDQALNIAVPVWVKYTLKHQSL